jgi:hypothetical protein
MAGELTAVEEESKLTGELVPGPTSDDPPTWLGDGSITQTSPKEMTQSLVTGTTSFEADGGLGRQGSRTVRTRRMGGGSENDPSSHNVQRLHLSVGTNTSHSVVRRGSDQTR